MDLLDIYSAVAFLCYLFATLAILSRLFHANGPNLKLVLITGTIAVLSHALTNSQILFATDAVNFSLPNVVSIVSLLITITVSIISFRYKINLLLPVVYGFAGVWQLLMIFIPPIAEFTLTADTALVFTHIVLSLIAYCILVIATLYAFQVAYINMKLKNKNLSVISHLPPLMQVEKQLFIILAIGTASLVIAELSGLVFLDNFLSKTTAHKTILSLLSLLLYLVILWGHFKQGWRGHRALMLTVIATALLTLSYFGSRFVKEFLLS